MHKWVLVTHCWTSNLSMEVLDNTENDLQIDHQIIDCYVITLTSEVQKLRTQYVTNPLNMGMFVIFPWDSINKTPLSAANASISPHGKITNIPVNKGLPEPSKHGKITNIPVNKGLPEPSKGTQNPSHTSLFCA